MMDLDGAAFVLCRSNVFIFGALSGTKHDAVGFLCIQEMTDIFFKSK